MYRESRDNKINVNYSNTFKICQIENAGKDTDILLLQLSISNWFIIFHSLQMLCLLCKGK